MRQRFIVIVIGIVMTMLPEMTLAQVCPNLPVPRMVIGQSGRVTPGNANNLRDIPSASGRRLGQIPAGGEFEVLDGPVCADGYHWWQVRFAGVEGWTVEGDGDGYWLEPIQPTPTSHPIATAIPANTPPTRPFVPPVAHINVLEAGARARVISDDPDDMNIQLNVRREPSRSAALVTQLRTDDVVTVLSDSVDAEGLLWREIETSSGARGWAAESLPYREAIGRTLLAECPVQPDEARIAFRIGKYLHTADTRAARICIHDRLDIPEWHTTYLLSFVYVPNRFGWSPDGTQFAYVDSVPGTFALQQDLFIQSADGLTRRRITQESTVVWFDWSPNGERLLFARNDQIWTMNADGSRLAALTQGSARKEWAAWLDDSETVVFIETTGERPSQMGWQLPASAALYQINVERGGLVRLYGEDSGVITSAALAPNRQILLLRTLRLTPIPGSRFADIGSSQVLILSPMTGEVVLDSPQAVGGWLPDSSGFLSLNAYPESRLVSWRFGEAVQDVSVQPPIPRDYYGLYSIGVLEDGRWGMFGLGPDSSALFAIDLATGELDRLLFAGS